MTGASVTRPRHALRVTLPVPLGLPTKAISHHGHPLEQMEGARERAVSQGRGKIGSPAPQAADQPSQHCGGGWKASLPWHLSLHM